MGQNIVVTFFIAVQGPDLQVCRWGSRTGGRSISDPALDVLVLIQQSTETSVSHTDSTGKPSKVSARKVGFGKQLYY